MQLITINGYRQLNGRSLKLSDRRYFTGQLVKHSPTPSQQFPKHCLGRHFLFPSCFVLLSIDFFRHTKFLYFKVIHERRTWKWKCSIFAVLAWLSIHDDTESRAFQLWIINLAKLLLQGSLLIAIIAPAIDLSRRRRNSTCFSVKRAINRCEAENWNWSEIYRLCLFN